jgi:hypothetical protein
MATLAGQRAQFTWALNQYNLAEDAERKGGNPNLNRQPDEIRVHPC